MEMERGTFSDIESKNTGNNDNFWNDNERVWKKGADRSFFELIRSHTMAGYYGSPRHGGNYMYVSYRMIGLDIPTIQGRKSIINIRNCVYNSFNCVIWSFISKLIFRFPNIINKLIVVKIFFITHYYFFIIINKILSS